jgi:transcriptional regulator with XRE-family HTH domain
MVGYRIIELREKRAWTQEVLGTRIGRTKWQISRLESGKTRLDLDTARKLAGIFEVPLSELLDAEPIGTASVAGRAAGLAEELVPYIPAPGDPMSAFLTPTRDLFRIDSDSLDKIALRRGDIVVVDYSQDAVTSVSPLAAVRVRLHPPDDFMRPVTLLRQFVPPRLLITNSSVANPPPIDMDRQDAHIVGVVISTHRDLR